MIRVFLSVFALVLIILSGCATAPPPVKEPTVFYPDRLTRPVYSFSGPLPVPTT